MKELLVVLPFVVSSIAYAGSIGQGARHTVISFQKAAGVKNLLTRDSDGDGVADILDAYPDCPTESVRCDRPEGDLSQWTCINHLHECAYDAAMEHAANNEPHGMYDFGEQEGDGEWDYDGDSITDADDWYGVSGGPDYDLISPGGDGEEVEGGEGDDLIFGHERDEQKVDWVHSDIFTRDTDCDGTVDLFDAYPKDSCRWKKGQQANPHCPGYRTYCALMKWRS